MELELKYGKDRLRFALQRLRPVRQILPRRVATLLSPAALLQRCLQKPVGSHRFEQLFQRVKNVAIVTPPPETQPVVWELLAPLFEILKGLQVPASEVKILVADGGEAGPERADLYDRFSIPESVPIVAHDAFDRRGLDFAGETRAGIPVFLNRDLLDAEHVILLGALEPDFLLGCSGGPRLIVPGCAGFETLARIFALALDVRRHRALFVEEDPTALHPLRRNLRDGYRCLPATFGIYPILNSWGKMVAAIAGHPEQAYLAGYRMMESLFRVPVLGTASVTVASCGGYPFDRHFASAFQALLNASRITRPGGQIVLLAACEGGPGPESHRPTPPRRSPAAMWNRARVFASPAQLARFGAQILAGEFDITLISHLPKEFVQGLGFSTADDPQAVIEDARKNSANGEPIGILPEGYRTVPAFCIEDVSLSEKLLNSRR